MLVKQIVEALEIWAPPALQETYDNSGLITGEHNQKITNVLVALDCTEAVVDEALELGCNLIVAHHPIVFSGLKKFSGNDYVTRVIKKAIKNDIAIYAMHTNLDNVLSGVNGKIAQKLGLTKTRILAPIQNRLLKLVTFVPAAHQEKVATALFSAGAGHIGNYSACSFGVMGEGTFKAEAGAQPFVGTIGTIHREPEVRLEVVVPDFKQQAVVAALLRAHPYEEVAYDIYSLKNHWSQTGAGLIGQLPQPVDTLEFLHHIKQQMQTHCVRYTQPIKQQVQTIAVCGGSGSFLLQQAIQQQADVLVTADFKYHQFFDADGKIVIADIGHFESEQFTIPLIGDFLKEKFPTFATLLTKSITNPVNYL